MAFPILGNPKCTFLDDSGDPLVGGTITVLDPDTDSKKASYPTASDADAGINQNRNPITLNSRGEPPQGLFGVDGQSYKLILKNSFSSVIWTMDDIKLPSDDDVNFVSVKDFGAVGDGATGDSAAIQDAIDSASAAGAKTVVFPADSTYLVNSFVSLKSGVDLCIERGATVKAGSGITSGVLVGTSANTVSNVRIYGGGTVDGNASNITGNIRGIQVTSGSGIRIENITVQNTRDIGILFSGTPDSRVEGCTVDETGLGGTSTHGIQAAGSSHRCHIIGNTITDPGGFGIRGDASTDLTIAFNHITGQTGGDGLEPIGVTSTCDRARIIGNTCSQGGDNGISCSAPASVVNGNTVTSAYFDGIEVSGNGSVIIGNTVKNSHQGATGTTRAGIHVNSANSVIIVGNRLFDDQGTKTQDYGIKFNGNEASCVIVGNSLIDNKTSSATGLNAANSNVVLANRGMDNLFYDGQDIQLGTTTGTKIGTGASQKLGFFGMTPVVQQSLTYSRTGETSPEAQIRAALAALGLVADNTTA